MLGAWGYNARKAAQAAAFYSLREGGDINVLKLCKLLYLTEREFMDRYDDPMFYDELVSMEHGPVPSITLNLISGHIEHEDWDAFISDRSGYSVGAADGVSYDSLNELSKADTKVLSYLWDKFGGMDRYQLRDYTHDNCPEWENPHGSSAPIPHARVYKNLKKDDSEALSDDIESYRIVSQNLALAL